MLVSIVPPVAGMAIIAISEQIFQAPFDAQGVAQIKEITAELLGDGHAFTVSSA